MGECCLMGHNQLFYLLYLFHICDCKCMCSHVKSVLISGFYRRFWKGRKPVLLGYYITQHIAVYRGFTSWNTSETSLWMMLVIFYRFCLVTQSEFLMLCYSNDTGLSNVRSKMPTVELKQSEWLMKERRGEKWERIGRVSNSCYLIVGHVS